jgi:hypothetical protein
MKLQFKMLNSAIKHKTIMLVFRFCEIWLQDTSLPEKMVPCTENESTGNYFSHGNSKIYKDL